jgi:tRNA wybutosine-synthesizing protein 5
MPLSEFAARVSSGTSDGTTERFPPILAKGETYYLRSVSGMKKTASHFPLSFPCLARDLFPGALFAAEATGTPTETRATVYPPSAYHSSALRIASRDVALWTHYDTHDNVLAQICGEKLVTLWSPDCEPFMHCEGSSCRVSDVREEVDRDPAFFDRKQKRDASFPQFQRVSRNRRTAFLEPGEALYIPALWFHHARAEPNPSKRAGKDGEKKNGNDDASAAWNGASVAVNVFWRSLPVEDHDPGDVFGNRDPPAARRACEFAARAGAALNALPEPQRRFYARRAVKRFAEQLGLTLEIP